jgi:hypothetical protein
MDTAMDPHSTLDGVRDVGARVGETLPQQTPELPWV